ncbi:MAG: hypothetical protein M8364_08120 [Methylobacter sp.]|uniref:hypothetical protein n=1 Tax=Methylobacter sp. TaxID=2051955 RepID=UPI002590A7FF|nr:hypothetical protein [Methylobacter sp.]MCL7420852.1 hypothetical protein [Methylobacter sp.]
MSWVTKTAGWLAIVSGLVGFALGMFDADSAILIVTNGMGYVGLDRKFKRAGLNGQAGVK